MKIQGYKHVSEVAHNNTIPFPSGSYNCIHRVFCYVGTYDLLQTSATSLSYDKVLTMQPVKLVSRPHDYDSYSFWTVNLGLGLGMHAVVNMHC